MWLNECHWVFVLGIARMREEARVRVAVVCKTASGLLVLGHETSDFVLAGMALATALVFEGALARQKEDADIVILVTATASLDAIAVAIARFFVTIDAVGTRAARSVFAHLHRLVVLLSLSTTAGAGAVSCLAPSR